MSLRRRFWSIINATGAPFKGLIDVARDGYLWFLDRGNGGAIKFVEGKPYVYQNVFRSLDPVTGRPDVDPAHKPGTGKRAEFCPGTRGGKNWPPIAYSPQTRMIYVPANNNVCGAIIGQEEVTYVAGRGYAGVSLGGPAGAAAVHRSFWRGASLERRYRSKGMDA